MIHSVGKPADTSTDVLSWQFKLFMQFAGVVFIPIFAGMLNLSCQATYTAKEKILIIRHSQRRWKADLKPKLDDLIAVEAEVVQMKFPQFDSPSLAGDKTLAKCRVLSGRVPFQEGTRMIDFWYDSSTFPGVKRGQTMTFLFTADGHFYEEKGFLEIQILQIRDMEKLFGRRQKNQ